MAWERVGTHAWVVQDGGQRWGVIPSHGWWAVGAGHMGQAVGWGGEGSRMGEALWAAGIGTGKAWHRDGVACK